MNGTHIPRLLAAGYYSLHELCHEFSPSHCRPVRDCDRGVFFAAAAAAQAPKAKAAKADKPAAAKPEKRPAVKPQAPASQAGKESRPAKQPAAERSPCPRIPPWRRFWRPSRRRRPSACSAAKTLADLGHPDLAKRFLKKVLDAKLSAQQLADLGEQFGVPMFLDMAGQAALLPEARQLADAVVAAAAARRNDAKRIAGLIEQLQDPSAEKRMQALAGLQEARRAALGPLLAVLADPARTAEACQRPHGAGRDGPAGAGTAGGRSRRGPTRSSRSRRFSCWPKWATRRRRSTWSGLVFRRRATPRFGRPPRRHCKQLTGQVPTRPEAVAAAARCREDLFRSPAADRGRGRRPGGVVAVGSGASGNVTVHSGTPADAARALAARFARQAYAAGSQRP